MTKHILIVVYVALVLAVSAFAKADSLGQGIISDVRLNQQTGVLSVHGVLSTPCNLKPMIVVDGIDHTNKVISLEVSTLVKSDVCVEMLGGTFDANLDLKDLPLNAGQTYTLSFSKYADQRAPLTYTARHADENIDAYKVDKKQLKGYLVAVENPVDGASVTTGFVLKNGDEEIPVISPDMDLNQFKNYQVWIGGYVINTAALDGSGDPLAQSGQAQMVIVPASISR